MSRRRKTKQGGVRAAWAPRGQDTPFQGGVFSFETCPKRTSPGELVLGARLWSLSKSSGLGAQPQIYPASYTVWGKSFILKMWFLACKMGMKTLK